LLSGVIRLKTAAVFIDLMRPGFLSGNFTYRISTNDACSLLQLSYRLSTMRLQRTDGVLPYLQNCFEQSYPQALDKPLRAIFYLNVYNNHLTH